MVLLAASSTLLSECIPVKRLSMYEIFLNTLFPVFLYLALKTIDYSNIPIMIFIVLTFLALLTVVYLQRLSNVKKIRVIYYLRHIVALCAVIVIIPSFLYFNFDDKAVHKYLEYQETKTSDSQATKKNEEKIVKLLSECDWGNLDSGKRSDILYEVIKYEAVGLGIPTPELQISNSFRELTRGSYDDKTGVIRLNNYYIGQDTLADCLRTAMHELYHSYQSYVIGIVKNLPEEQKNVSYFDKAIEWQYANDNYAEDHKNINTYENNALEVDARAFADKIVEKYLKE